MRLHACVRACYVAYAYTFHIAHTIADGGLVSTPGSPLEEGRPGIDCLRIRGVFRILSSKFDRKLNFARRARTL